MTDRDDPPPLAARRGTDTRPRPQPADAPAGESADDAIDLRRIVGILLRHKHLIVGVTAVVTVLAGMYTTQLTARYRATAEVVVQPNRDNVLPSEDIRRDLPLDWTRAQTESAVIASRRLAKRAVERLDFARSPAMDPSPPTALARAKAHVTDFLAPVRTWLMDAGLGDSSTDRPNNAAPSGDGGGRSADRPAWQTLDSETDDKTRYMISRYLSNLSVRPDEDSRVIRIGYVSKDPEFAAAAANMAAQVYIESQREAKGEAASEAVAWLDKRVAEAKEDLLQAERELEQFRSQAGITEVGRGRTLEGEQLQRLNNQLSSARAELADVRARYKQVQSLLEGGGDSIDSAAAVLNSSLIERLRLQEVELQRQIAELSNQYRERHPKLKRAQSQLADLRARIQNEVAKIAANLENELAVARSRVNNLQAELSEKRAAVEEQGNAQVQLSALKSEVEANRQLYETLLDRYKEVSIQSSQETEANARIINAAQVPGGPFYPNERTIILAAFMLSAMASVGLAFLLEMLDPGFRALRQLEEHTRGRGLGILPRVALKRNERPHATAALTRGGRFAECIRVVRSGLSRHGTETDRRVTVVTSSVPGEGKTSTALSIAAQDVAAGRDAIVVDCDLRVANLGYYLGDQGGLGLSDYLRGEVGLSEVIRTDPDTGIPFISAGSPADHPDELFAGEAMAAMLEDLRARYSRIVLDCPPVLAVADTATLAWRADMVLYLVRWGKTRRGLVEAGLRRLVEAEAPDIGLALSFVDPRRHKQYGYAEYDTYCADYGRYYAQD